MKMILPRASICASALASILIASAFLPGCTHPTRAQFDIDRGWAVYGVRIETTRGIDPEVTPEQLAPYADTGTRVVLSGTITEVCRTMGCWLDIAGSTGATVRIMNKDHAFFIPRNARGRGVHAIGYAVMREQSVEMLKHLAQDAGKPQAQIDAITEPKSSLLFIADSVILPSGGLDAPVAIPVAETPEAETPAAETPAAEASTIGAVSK